MDLSTRIFLEILFATVFGLLSGSLGYWSTQRKSLFFILLFAWLIFAGFFSLADYRYVPSMPTYNSTPTTADALDIITQNKNIR